MSKKEIYHRFKRNAAMILGSRLVFGVLNIFTSILFVRLFGLTDLGVVILLQSYTRIFNVFIKFNSWQAVVTYGAVLQENKNDRGFKRLIGLLLSIDFLAMLVGVAIAIIFTPYAASIFEWPEQVKGFASIYVLTVFFAANAAPAGILRLFDRVDVLAIKYALTSVIRFFGVLLVYYMGGNVFHLVLVWFTAAVIAGLWPMIICALELYRRKLLPVFRVSWFKAGVEFKGIWRFLGFANISNITGIVYRTGTTLFIGTFLGAAPAAIFAIAYQFTGGLARPARLLGPIISPEFAKLVAKGDWRTFRQILSKQLKITGTFLVVASLVIFSSLSFILEFIYGPDVLPNLWLFRFLLVFALLKVLTFTFEPAILSANKPGTLLIIRTAVAAIYTVIGLSLFAQYGIEAAGFAAMISQIIYIYVFWRLGKKLLKKRVRKMEK